MNRNDIFFELRNRGYGAEPSGVTSSSSSSSPLAGHFAWLFYVAADATFFYFQQWNTKKQMQFRHDENG